MFSSIICGFLFFCDGYKPPEINYHVNFYSFLFYLWKFGSDWTQNRSFRGKLYNNWILFLKRRIFVIYVNKYKSFRNFINFKYSTKTLKPRSLLFNISFNFKTLNYWFFINVISAVKHQIIPHFSYVNRSFLTFEFSIYLQARC